MRHAHSLASSVKWDMFVQVFAKQYSNWHAQFEDWKQKHVNHPNKAQFVQYEKQVCVFRLKLNVGDRKHFGMIRRHCVALLLNQIGAHNKHVYVLL